MSSDLTIRAATHEDWSQIFPFWARIVDDGRTYAYPEGLTSPPGARVVDGDGARPDRRRRVG
ncbi:hypothetical protein [Janibacter hoylei]|uniref:hypothetical protein n=1 Tax=Janibacter hoylei TaxID=364298 RepID=UPI000A059B64|nr:hypothetical protein [Janibacter hoylei]